MYPLVRWQKSSTVLKYDAEVFAGNIHLSIYLRLLAPYLLSFFLYIHHSIYTCILSIDTYVLGLNIHLSISPRAMLAIFLCTHTIYRSIQYRSIHTYYLSIYTHILAFNIYLSTSHRATLTHIEQRGACLLHQSSAVALGVYFVHCIRFPSSSSSSSFSALAPE